MKSSNNNISEKEKQYLDSIQRVNFTHGKNEMEQNITKTETTINHNH